VVGEHRRVEPQDLRTIADQSGGVAQVGKLPRQDRLHQVVEIATRQFDTGNEPHLTGFLYVKRTGSKLGSLLTRCCQRLHPSVDLMLAHQVSPLSRPCGAARHSGRLRTKTKIRPTY
jgi:hypothetical protein